jgi:choice-of-anchor B domain-containing protein
MAVCAVAFALAQPCVAQVNCDTIPPRAPFMLDSAYTFSFGTYGGTDCWGWTGPDGTEYAIMGIDYGIVFVNASALEVADSVQGPGPCGASWRDIKTYRHYCYAVSECTGTNAGLMVIDMQYLPDSVHYLGSYALFGVTSHNLTIDTAKGFLYDCEPDYSGFRIFDLSNPSNPVELPGVSTPDIHDLYARNDTLYVAEGYNSSFSIWNMADKYTPVMLARVAIPPGDGYSHNIWPTDDGRYVVTTEETGYHTIKVWNIEDLNDIQLVSQFLAPSNLAHNAHCMGDHVVMSHYESGVEVVDISVPECPVEVARFDTYTAAEGPAFAGCWGAYPFTANGLIYGSNLDGRLFILTTTDTVVFTNFTATPVVATAPVQVQFTDQSKSNAVAWNWDFGDGDFSAQENPSHQYDQGGLYSVQLEITTGDGHDGHRTRSNYITVLGADTLGVDDLIAPADTNGYWEINCDNALPIAELILPIDITNVTEVVFFDSVSLVGTRAEYFESNQIVFDNRYNGQQAVRLRANVGGGSPPLPPGSGPIARVYYRTRFNASVGDTAHLSVTELGSYSFKATSLTTEFTPAFVGGTLTIGTPCDCSAHGDIVGDGFFDVFDLNALIDYLFISGERPPQDPICPHEDRGDYNCDGFDDSLDLAYLIALLYENGPAPCDPCACNVYPDDCAKDSQRSPRMFPISR